MNILIIVLILVLLYNILLISQGSSQCPGLEAYEVASADAPSTNGLLPASFLQKTNREPLPLTLLHSYNIVCLSVGLTQGTHRSASIVANYTCTGHVNCTGRPQLTQFEVECLIINQTPTWSSNLTFLIDETDTLSLDNSGDLTTEVRTDCAFCIDPMIIPVADDIHHCAPCSDQCYGLRLCISSDPGSCCNVYQDSSCSLTCDEGYTPDNENQCESVQCPTLQDPENGGVNMTETSPGSAAVYYCNERYRISGNELRVCENTGQWSGSTPSCIEIQCGNLTRPENGRLTFSGGTLFGSKATYSCYDGYLLNGTRGRLCTANGTWDDTNPTTCIAVLPTMPGPSNVTSGTIIWIVVAVIFVLIFVAVTAMLAGYGVYRVKGESAEREETIKQTPEQPVEPLVAIMANTR